MIYNNSLSFAVLYFFIISILGHLFFEVESFTPLGRKSHSSVLVGNKLYFFGGFSNDTVTLNQIFYLDLSQQFNVSNPPWVDLTTTIPAAAIPFTSAYGTAVVSDINKDPTIYLFGGIMIDLGTFKVSNSSLYAFNLNSTKWSIPNVKGEEPERRMDMKSVIDNTGKIYVFGGGIAKSNKLFLFDEMVILNTVDLTWSISFTIPNSSIGRIYYTATILPNGIIVYIGGTDNRFLPIDINKINLYNTNSSTWTTMTAKPKDSIDDRFSHTAVLTPDSKIIIYGGAKVLLGVNIIYGVQATPDLAVLNTNIEPFEWTAPQVSSNVGTVPPLMSHTADLVGNSMIVAFGNITQPESVSSKYNPNIYVMDIRSYTWVDTFDNSDNKLTIIIVTISVIIGIAVLIGLGFLVHKRNKRKKEKDALTVKYNNVTTVNNSSYNRDVTIVNNNP